MARTLPAWAINRAEKTRSVTYSTDREYEANERYLRKILWRVTFVLMLILIIIYFLGLNFSSWDFLNWPSSPRDVLGFYFCPHSHLPVACYLESPSGVVCYSIIIINYYCLNCSIYYSNSNLTIIVTEVKMTEASDKTCFLISKHRAFFKYH